VSQKGEDCMRHHRHKHLSRHLLSSINETVAPEKEERAKKVEEEYHSFMAKAHSDRALSEKIADGVVDITGSFSFVVLHIIVFTGWIMINTNLIPGLVPFDPYPFGLLTMIVSLEAIFLSIFVLISQNRQSEVSDMRSEVDYQVNRQAEQELTKLLEMVSDIHQHFELNKKQDRELEEMKKDLNPEKIEAEIKQEIQNESSKDN
jgi:uncharacterized membrane protein